MRFVSVTVGHLGCQGSKGRQLSQPPEQDLRPRWQGKVCGSWLNGASLKAFRARAPVQERTLAAFEEEGGGMAARSSSLIPIGGQ
jgi:hypothetical protein